MTGCVGMCNDFFVDGLEGDFLRGWEEDLAASTGACTGCERPPAIVFGDAGVLENRFDAEGEVVRLSTS